MLSNEGLGGFWDAFGLKLWPYLVFASVLSLCSASLLQSIGFYLTDNFDNLEDITLLISFTFVLLSISTIVSQNMFTSMFNLNNYKLLIYGCLILTISYCVMALSDSIATYFSSIIMINFILPQGCTPQ